MQYSKGKKEGVLMKRGKRDRKFHPRRFIISSQDNTLKYYKDQVLYGPQRNKTCLRGFPKKRNSNPSPQLQRLTKELKICSKQV